MKFLINTFTHWNEPPRARHQVAQALALNHQVVFVAANKPGWPHIQKNRIDDNLTILTPYFPVGNKIRYRLRVINELYQIWLFRKLIKNYNKFLVINFDFTAIRLYNYFKNIIFYCNDSFVAISKKINPVFISRYHEKCFSTVSHKATFCVGVSELLKEKLAPFNTNSYTIPLGSPDINKYQLNPVMLPSGKPLIKVGLVGFIKLYSISYHLINSLLENKDITISLIGPIDSSFLSHIKDKNKVLIKGPLYGKALYEEINTFDVAIAPYSPTITNNDQIGVGLGSKTYQYLALGKPVVISRMAGLKDIDLPDGFIYIADKEEDFPELMIKAHQENTHELIKQRIEYAKKNTWDKRMERLIELFQEHGTS